MKKGILLIAAVSVFSAVMPVFAENSDSRLPTGEQIQDRNECEMIIRNCYREADTIQQKIARVEGEIKKGTSVYSRDELRKLQQKLQDAKEMLERLQTR